MSDSTPFSVGYGTLSRMLAGLMASDEDAITSRFRKLRLRSFPDDFGDGTGNRVAYDLPRVLAFASVFGLNGLFIPQGHAVELVSRSWPELCRAAIAAAIGAGLVPAPRAMPSDAGQVAKILPLAFRDEPVVAATNRPGKIDLASPSISIDQSRVVSRLVEVAEAAGCSRQLGGAFAELERLFGWSPPVEIARLERTGSFLSEGPYVARAQALLEAPKEDFDEARPDRRMRLQWLLDYLERPAPVDAWIAEGGTAENEARLKHLIHFWARDMGLKPRKEWLSTVGIKVGSDLRTRALELLSRV